MSKIIEEDKSNNNKFNLFYLNTTIKEYELPENFSKFKSDIKELFNIDSRLNEEINIIYALLKKERKQTIEKNIEVKTEDDYQSMKTSNINEIKDKTILIEIEKNDIRRKLPETFEEEIKNVVESEIRDAGERIRQYLSISDKKYYPSTKIQDKNCDECKDIIVGDIYKNALKVENKFYCEKCSLNINDPMFVIH